ncbi:MAG: hypothetical protein NC082_03495 [Clostridiales bacterium]|nr:hypothetical protein [Clostridiales bacterium]
MSGRNKYFSHLRNNDMPTEATVLLSGSKQSYGYRYEVPWQEWMDHSDLTFATATVHCCEQPVAHGDKLVARHDYGVPPVAFDPLYIALTGDSTVTIEAQGSAFVDFVVNRTELKPDYRGNRGEIDKIIKSIDVVAQDPDAIITRITIKGYASPEGSYSNNVRLAMGRTNTLKEYVAADLTRRYAGFNPKVFMTDYEPEDWGGLIRWLEQHDDFENRDAILAIAKDTSIEPDPRNSKIQNLYPAQYKYLLAEVYPALRHSDYTIRYNIKTGIDVEHLKEMMEVTPERLRPVDFYLIASTYPVGSDSYNRALLLAAKQYPADEEAALNAANIYLAKGDLENAVIYAQRTGNTPEAIFTRANIAARQGQLEKAASLLQSAADQGMEQAKHEYAQLRAILDREPVTYY